LQESARSARVRLTRRALSCLERPRALGQTQEIRWLTGRTGPPIGQKGSARR
jgi:hypothetical protein